jgi:hypothetical protein
MPTQKPPVRRRQFAAHLPPQPVQLNQLPPKSPNSSFQSYPAATPPQGTPVAQFQSNQKSIFFSFCVQFATNPKEI